MPIVDATKLTKMIDVPGVDQIDPDTVSVGTGSDTEGKLEDGFYDIITTRNVFSPQRKDWVVKAAIPKASGLIKKPSVKKRGFAGKPKKFVLHGILIAGDIKKALINNPLKGISKEKTLYIVEGEDLDGYKVKSIEKDRIRLDWNGEEIVVLLYSGPKKIGQQGNEGKKPGRRMKRLKAKKGDISLKKQGEIEGSIVASVVDNEESMNDGSPYKGNIFNDTLFNPLSMAHESLYKPENDDIMISPDEAREVVEALPDLGTVDTKHAKEEQQIAMVGSTDSIYMVLEEEKLKQKELSKVPSQIILKGIVIAGKIKKALVNIPKSEELENKSLYVEEGDGLEGYLVTKIERVQIRLDSQGEEIILTFPNLY